jgi:hypothetical protein
MKAGNFICRQVTGFSLIVGSIMFSAPKAFSENAVISILTDTLLTRFFLRSLKTEMLFFTADPVIRHDWKNSFKVISGFSRIVI